jgi:hypothetical protein
VLGQMRGTFALSNSISAHTFILVLAGYKSGAIVLNKYPRLLLPRNYVRIVAFMLQRVFLSHITISFRCSTTIDFLLLTEIMEELHTTLSACRSLGMLGGL